MKSTSVPSRMAVVLFIAIAAALLLAVVWPAAVIVAVMVDAAIVAGVLVEGRALRRIDVTVRRDWPARVQVHKPTELAFEIDNRSRRRVTVSLRQPWPASAQADDNRVIVSVGPGERVRTTLAMTPRRRGRLAFDPLEVDLQAPLGLAVRRWAVAEGGGLSVYPDLAALWAYERLRRSQALGHMGVHRQRQLGAGREYEQLRDYLPDDDYRDVNWKATARRQKPVTTLYQAERSRDVLLCLDHGRMMGNPIGQGAALDHAVDAAIMVAYACMRQGDRVGLALFSDRVQTMMRPASGAAAVHSVIQQLVDAEPDPLFPSYAAVVEAVRRQQSHRSLIMLLTDLNDPQLAADLAQLMPLLSRRHVVVVVSLEDTLITRRATEGAASSEELFEVLAARELLGEREAHRRALVKTGVHVLEADAETLSLKAVNQYLAIKSRQLL